MNRLLLLALMTCTLTVSAQKSPMKYGDIPIEDLNMTVYDKDSSAAAVVLFDYGKAYVSINNINATLNYERHVRIKILKKDGLGNADVGILLYHSGAAEEKVSNLKATTYNLENGKVVETKMDKSGIFKEKFNRNYNLQKFTFPNVKEGSIIEYTYTVLSEFLANFPNWQFQRNIPVRHSEYWAHIPEFFVMEKYMQGYLLVTNYEIKDRTQSGYNEKAHHWLVKDAPAFKKEPYMTSEEDYVSKINFALAYINFPGSPSREIMGSWEKLKTELLESESFGKIISGSGFLKKTVEEVTAGKIEPLQKIEAIHSYIKQTLEWDGTRDLYADNLKKVFEVKKGTAADINLALASMLTKAGLEVDMVLLSTRSHGFIRKQYPMEDQLDYVVCVVRLEGKPVFLDATEKYIPVGVLPERCLNGEGLIVSSRNFGWIALDTKTKSRTAYSTDLILNAAGELSGKLNISFDGYDALETRDEYFTDGEESYLKDFRDEQSKWQIEKSAFENMKDINKAAKEIHELQINEHTSLAGDVIYLNPFVIAQLEKNPFTSETREYPVDYGSLQETIYSCRITLPDGFTVDEIPQSKIFMLPGNAAKYLYNVALTGNVISITSSFQINRTLFAQTDYPNLREFYNQVVAKEAEQIVLKKK